MGRSLQLVVTFLIKYVAKKKEKGKIKNQKSKIKNQKQHKMSQLNVTTYE